MFFGNGAATVTWAAHIPHVRTHLSLSDGQLGLIILCIAAGAVSAMIAAAPVSARYGPHRVTLWSAVALLVFVPIAVTAGSLWVLVPAGFALGGAMGTMDVAMNAVAADVEHRRGRPVMSSFHGMWSLGSLFASLSAVAAYAWHVPPVTHSTVMAALVFVFILPSLRALPPATRGLGAADGLPKQSGRVRWPKGALLIIGVLAFVALATEGSVMDWSGVVLRDDFGASDSVARWGLGAFSVAMTAFRFAGDAINRRVGPVMLVASGLGLAALGLGLGMASGSVPVAVVGFAFMGAGLANAVPVLFTAAAARGRTAAEGLSSIAVLGYVGFLVAPPTIGGLAELTSLPTALGVVAVACALVTPFARVVAPAGDASRPTPR